MHKHVYLGHFSRVGKERQRQNAVKNVDEYVDEMQEVLKTKPKAKKEVESKDRAVGILASKW